MATDNRVGSTQHHERVSILVLGATVPASLALLDVTDAAVVDVLVRVAVVGAERIKHIAGRLAAVLEVTVLVDLQGVEAGLDVLELADHGDEVTGLLRELDAAHRVRVSEEVELARGLDRLRSLIALPVVVHRLGHLGRNVTRTEGAAAHPGVALRLSRVARLLVALLLARGLLIVAAELLLDAATLRVAVRLALGSPGGRSGGNDGTSSGEFEHFCFY